MRTARTSALAVNDDGSLRRTVKRNLSAFVGLAGLAAAAAVAASLATWAVTDPSLSLSTDAPIRNVLGWPGAIVADFLTQMFGIAASLVLVPPVLWAWRVVFGMDVRFTRYQALTWFGAILATTLALTGLPVTPNWPLPTGLGGAIGDVLMRLPAGLAGGALPGAGLLATTLLSGLAAVTLTLHACGLILYREPADLPEDGLAEAPPARRRASKPVVVEADEGDFLDDDFEDDDEREPGRLALLAGAATHVALSAGAALRRRLAGGNRREALDPASLDLDRVEPRMHDAAWSPQPIEDDDEIDDGYADDEGPRRTSRRARVAKAAAKPRRGRRSTREAQGSLLEPDGFNLPPLHLLTEPPADSGQSELSEDALEQNARLLEGVLDDFGVRGEIINVRPGPVVTLYELEPAPGIKSARVIGLADDIARSMSAISCRVAVIPGKNAIGIELPNTRRETVYLRELLASRDFEDSKSRLGLCLGKTIGGEPVIADLARMPHLLVAGTTGSGKSVSINTMILSLLYRMSPEECRLIMIDPKMLELSTYDGIPHLLTPVVTDPKQAVVALKWTVREMEDRYRKMSKLGVRNLHGFNSRVAEAAARGETLTRTVQTGFDPDTGEAIYEQEELALEPMPFIVVIIDEMADLMMVAGKDIEGAVQRLAQMARAAGIHVVMATQRPSVDVITGTIKANFPTRISFQVTSKIDSRTILGEQGAEQLLGQGDMLYMAGGGRIQRVHGPFVSDEEVEEVVAHLKDQGAPDYLHTVTMDNEDDPVANALADDGDSSANTLYDQAVAIVLRDRKASTSYIQRRLSIGYNRAASIIERMEEEGVVGPANHAGKRDILVEDDEGESRFA